MSSYVQMFVGPPGLPECQLVADLEAATGLPLEQRSSPRRQYWGSSGERAVLLDADTMDYDDEAHLPSFAAHPFEVVFYTAEKTIESERRFLDETFRRLRASGRYDLFATQDLFTRIDPE